MSTVEASFNGGPSLVVTSIAAPNAVLRDLAQGSLKHDFRFYVIGDVPSPMDFALDGCDFYSLARQEELDFQIVPTLPKRHYARKNIGYLLAMRRGSRFIVETDDDNFPRDAFWAPRSRHFSGPRLESAGWVNVYGYFSDRLVWPRGLPLEEIHRPPPSLDGLPAGSLCPIQQGLADANPDVDAIYRLVLPLPLDFALNVQVALARGSWCPFNSQNTAWFPEAYPLLYLPSYCSFRMTDIWRSLVAQRIAWENGWAVLFHAPTVWQERNEHNLMRDFKDELPGYLNNRRIAEVLDALPLRAGARAMGENLLLCYEALVKLGVVDKAELALVEAWGADVGDVTCVRTHLT